MSRQSEIFQAVYARADDKQLPIQSAPVSTEGHSREISHSVTQTQPISSSIVESKAQSRNGHMVGSIGGLLPIPHPWKSSINSEPSFEEKSPWTSLKILGKIVLEDEFYTLCTKRSKRNTLVLVKKMDRSSGCAEYQRLISIAHKHIVRPKMAFVHGDNCYLGFDDYSVSLLQLLHINEKLDKDHVEVIAQSIFSALQHLALNGYIHNNICAQNVRFLQRTERVMICICMEAIAPWAKLFFELHTDFSTGDFTRSTKSTEENYHSADLLGLAFLLIACINKSIGRCPPKDRSVEGLRKQLDPIKSSNFESLSSFLQDLLDIDKPALSVIKNKYEFMTRKDSDTAIFIPHLKLAGLECLSFFQPGVYDDVDSGVN